MSSLSSLDPPPSRTKSALASTVMSKKKLNL
jgi:hypothetical protein